MGPSFSEMSDTSVCRNNSRIQTWALKFLCRSFFNDVTLDKVLRSHTWRPSVRWQLWFFGVDIAQRHLFMNCVCFCSSTLLHEHAIPLHFLFQQLNNLIVVGWGVPVMHYTSTTWFIWRWTIVSENLRILHSFVSQNGGVHFTIDIRASSSTTFSGFKIRGHTLWSVIFVTSTVNEGESNYQTPLRTRWIYAFPFFITVFLMSCSF